VILQTVAYNVHMNQYQSIEKALHYIAQNSKNALSIDDIAHYVGVSGSHLQKLFVAWCGVSPKQFQRFLKLEYAKKLLQDKNNILMTSNKTGLSGTGRLHDLFVDIEGMTPGEYQSGGKHLTICYSVHDSLFGIFLVASTSKGICNVLFLEQESDAEKELRSRWAQATLISKEDKMHIPVVKFFMGVQNNTTKKIKLHVQGTNYQLQVWKALLSIPDGSVESYGTVAASIGESGGLAARAIGTAIGANPVGYIIPCHRVIKSTGEISGYRWGVDRKRVILGYEAAQNTHEE
jgi:AraC family transcriptional regulator, regulatory protein of adaptative response / methylated-DNA-[protein]-cysteine methyltransferase